MAPPVILRGGSGPGMPLLDYTIRLLGLSETIHRWHTTIGALEAE